MSDTTAQEQVDLNFLQSAFKGNFVTIGSTKVYNMHLLSPKARDVVNHVLTKRDEKWGVDHLIIHQKEPEDKPGLWVKSLKTIVINLGEIWENCETAVKEEDHYGSIRLNLWDNFIFTLFHELCHSKMAATNDPDYDKSSDEDKDELADIFANEETDDLGIHYEIEPGPMSHEPFFGPRYMKLFIENIQNNEESWAVRQNEMHDETYVYLNERTGQRPSTYREYLEASSKIKSNVDKWDSTAPKPLRGFKGELPMEEKPKQETPAATEPIETPAAPVAQEQPTESAVESYPDNAIEDDSHIFYDDGSDFSGRDLENEAVAALCGEGTTVPPGGLDFFGGIIPMSGQTAAPPPQLTPPADPPTHQCPTCTCGHVWENGQNFCPKCGSASNVDPCVINTGVTKAQDQTTPTPHTMPQQPVVQQPVQQPVIQQPVQQPVIQQPVQQPVVQQPPAYQQTPVPTPAQGVRGFTENLRTNLPQTGMSDEEMKNISLTLWHRIDRFIFQNCGWRMPLSANVMADPNDDKNGFDANYKYAVLDGIDISDIPNIEKFVVACRTMEPVSNKNKKLAITDGKLRGFIAKNAGIPMFSIYLNYHGHELKRNIIPQNPWKQRNGDYSAPAKLAQQGHQITWVLDGDDRKPGFNAKLKYVNGQPEVV